MARKEKGRVCGEIGHGKKREGCVGNMALKEKGGSVLGDMARKEKRGVCWEIGHGKKGRSVWEIWHGKKKEECVGR